MYVRSAKCTPSKNIQIKTDDISCLFVRNNNPKETRYCIFRIPSILVIVTESRKILKGLWPARYNK